MKSENYKNRIKTCVIILFILSLIGLGVSSYLVYIHYSDNGSVFCSFGERLDCNIVNKGAYSTIDGPINLIFGSYLNIPIPNSIISALFFVLILIILGYIDIHKDKIKAAEGGNVKKIYDAKLIRYMQVLLLAGMAYSLYLVYIEAYVLFTWCIFCIILDAILTAMLVISYLIEFSRGI